MADVFPFIIQEVKYYRALKPPTLEQYLVRRKLKEVSDEAKEVTGTTRYKGQLMPKSAKIIKTKMAGITADKIKTDHPDWIRDYPDYLKSLKVEYEERLKKATESAKEIL